MKRKRIIITIIMFFIILCGATIFLIVKFDVWNPFSSCLGMLEILFTDKGYTIVQNIPNKVGFSKTLDTSSKSSRQYLDEYMENRGFYLEAEKGLGGMSVYSNRNEEERIIVSGNKYYSKWHWCR